MGLIALRRSIGQKTDETESLIIGQVEAAPVAMITLDDESYEPLATIAHEISRELGGDGLLVTWHENAGEPCYLFADGICVTHLASARGVADIGASAVRLGMDGARSLWRTLADDPSSAVLTTSIPADRGVLTIGTLFRRVGRSTRMKAGEATARLLPLLQPFFRIWLSRMRTEATLRALTAVVNDSDIGVVLLDRSGQIMFGNSTAEGLLVRGDGLRRKGMTVVGENMTDTSRLPAAIEAVLMAGQGRREKSSHHILALRRRNAPSLMVAVVANVVNSGGAGDDCAAIIYVVDPNQDLQPLVEPVCRFYGLSPAETRLVCNLVAGKSLSEAAEILHLRPQTARTYLKQIFMKTDTNRQAELVRLLLLSAVRTGHVTPAAASEP
ncbi:MAG: helix-turn-helix transcriptional regulator [Oxalobacteraceae bacterium]|nr:MAG: helix-turn-helix transcriptional regulator [Oxalobacteraceae bacterium]